MGFRISPACSPLDPQKGPEVASRVLSKTGALVMHADHPAFSIAPLRKLVSGLLDTNSFGGAYAFKVPGPIWSLGEDYTDCVNSYLNLLGFEAWELPHCVRLAIHLFFCV